MNIIVKRAVEIAVGIALGNLAYDGTNKIVKVSKKVVKKIKKK